MEENIINAEGISAHNQESVENIKPKNAIFSGAKYLFVDMGVSVLVGLILWVFMGAAGASQEQIENNFALIIIGYLVSMYAAFLLYRQY